MKNTPRFDRDLSSVRETRILSIHLHKLHPRIRQTLNLPVAVRFEFYDLALQRCHLDTDRLLFREGRGDNVDVAHPNSEGVLLDADFDVAEKVAAVSPHVIRKRLR